MCEAKKVEQKFLAIVFIYSGITLYYPYCLNLSKNLEYKERERKNEKVTCDWQKKLNERERKRAIERRHNFTDEYCSREQERGRERGRCFTEEQRERAQERNRERRHNVIEEQREKELERDRVRRRNFTGEQRETEQ